MLINKITNIIYKFELNKEICFIILKLLTYMCIALEFNISDQYQLKIK